MEESEKHVSLPMFTWAACSEKGGDARFHVHNGTELFFLITGHSTIDVGDISLEGFAGDLYILPADVPHNQICHEPTTRDYVIFHAAPNWLDDSPRIVDLQGEKWIPRWMEDLRCLCRVQSEPGQAADCANGLLISILHRLRQVEDQRREHRHLHPSVAAAVRWMEDNLAMPISLDDISEHVGVSASHLAMLFRGSIGISPMKHLRLRRMNLAHRLLADPYRTISQIAVYCGYDDANYFTRIFRKHHGCTPTEYRKEKSAT